MKKPEIKLSKWRFIGGKIEGVDHNDLHISATVLKRPMNPKEGSKIETMKAFYILLGEGEK